MEKNKITYDFGEWVIVDNNPKDERQVIQYDILNDEYTLDKNGMWDYFKADRVSLKSLNEKIEREGE